MQPANLYSDMGIAPTRLHCPCQRHCLSVVCKKSRRYVLRIYVVTSDKRIYWSRDEILFATVFIIRRPTGNYDSKRIARFSPTAVRSTGSLQVIVVRYTLCGISGIISVR